MDFDFYQDAASGTDQFAGRNSNKEDGLMIPLLGLAGETGTLLAEFKKKIRDKESYQGFHERAEEELGDILWYLSNIASRLELSLSEIASKNLHKTNERWPISGDTQEMFHFFDEDCSSTEQLPRSLKIRIFESEKGKRAHMETSPDKLPLGDPLTNNAYDDDGYRFHDVMHLANMAVLGWSPVIRSLLKRKRKSQPKIDEVEDGQRATVFTRSVQEECNRVMRRGRAVASVSWDRKAWRNHRMNFTECCVASLGVRRRLDTARPASRATRVSSWMRPVRRSCSATSSAPPSREILWR